MWVWRVELVEYKNKVIEKKFGDQKDLNNYLRTLSQDDFTKLHVFDPDNRCMNGNDYYKFYLK